MAEKGKLDGTWLRASVLGCLWAASEIVLGSFLHNLRIPFTGNIMTGIAIILLVSVGYLWDRKGLFWRAGLICALMKSISPSAMIFGPMIAICCEAFLLELSVRIVGRNIGGYLIGGMLAMLWNLVHFIANFIIFYGLDIVGLYKRVAMLAAKQLNMQFDNGWMPVVVLAVLYMMLGLVSGIVGIYIGIKLKNKPAGMISMPAKNVMQRQQTKDLKPFGFSVIWLFISIAAMIGELCLISFCNPRIWVPAGSVLIVVWAVRYRNALRPLRKPKFWVSFIVITLLMGWLYSGLQDGSFFGLEGLAAGLQMNFRAALMIIGFAAIGRELVNPIIKKYFSGSRFRQLAGSLEVAFDTLPLVIANLPAPKNILKRPVGTMKQLVGQADTWLEKISLQFSDKPFVIIVTGGFGSGKSRTVFALAEMLKLENIQIGGFVAPSVRENGERVGYDIYDIAHSNSHQLARTYGDDTMSFIGRFYFRTDGIETGKRILADASLSKPDWVIIDEIGPWEMAGQGWAQSINHLFGTSTANMIWVVRETLVEDVIHGWNIEDYQIIRASESAAHDMMKIIRQRQLNSDSSAKSGQATHD